MSRSKARAAPAYRTRGVQAVGVQRNQRGRGDGSRGRPGTGAKEDTVEAGSCAANLGAEMANFLNEIVAKGFSRGRFAGALWLRNIV